MKIILVGNNDDSKGGAQCLMELATLLQENYHFSVIVINPKHNKLNDLCDERGIENYSLGYIETICQMTNSRMRNVLKYTLKKILYHVANVRAKYQLHKLDLQDVDLVHSNTTATDFGKIISHEIAKPHIWHIREFGKEDFNFSYLRFNYAEYINRNSDGIIAISQVIKDAWQKKGLDVTKCEMIYDGVLAKKFKNITNDCRFRNDLIHIAFCGGISKAKGQYQLIEAMHKIPAEVARKFRVDIYGSGDTKYLEHLKMKINQYGLENLISFKGYTTNVNDVLGQYEIGMVCSKSEGFGRVTVEYMMSGLCVVATDTGANPELLGAGKFGILYHNGDVDKLADCLLEIATTPTIIDKISQKSKKHAFENYAFENNVEKIVSIYKQILNC